MRCWFCVGWIAHRSWERLPGHLALVPEGKVISHRLGRDCGTIYGIRNKIDSLQQGRVKKAKEALVI
ncbi:hypothetical protein HanPSC8_Chr07g0282221 [Helianthus annuus]|nr:hypothetical protein HanIR_MTg0916891 [Helianthus annuus]KAJ0904441.1 hypothetical protein HanPSC8_Chr07g0282221 [Helianthus annuus]